MKGILGFSGKTTTSIVFLLAVIFIALTLGSVRFLVNDNSSSLPNVGLEGNENMEEEEEDVEDVEDVEKMKNKKEGMGNKERKK
jgi:hypothetical protein